jgi:hypothetical protein
MKIINLNSPFFGRSWREVFYYLAQAVRLAMNANEQNPVLIIGRIEKVSFPDLSLIDIDAKVDTGAYTSALHCHDIIVKNESGNSVLCFKLLGTNHSEYDAKQHQFSDFSKKSIKNSSGNTEDRYIIKTRIKIGERIIKTSISLTDRGNMRYPVLIGRKLLRKKFVVDVNETYLLNR